MMVFAADCGEWRREQGYPQPKPPPACRGCNLGPCRFYNDPLGHQELRDLPGNSPAPPWPLPVRARMLNVELTRKELEEGSTVGARRRANGLANRREKPGRRDGHAANQFRGDKEDEQWGKDCEGALGELAFAKAMALPWTGAHSRIDVPGWEVRTRATGDPKREDLGLHEQDTVNHADARYALVTGRFGSYRLRGWIWTRDVKRVGVWHEHLGSWLVKPEQLTPFELWRERK